MSISAAAGALLLAAAAAYLGLAAYTWRHRNGPGAWPLVVLLLAVGTWTLCYALELNSSTVAAARVWSAAKFAGIVALPPALVVFVQRYTAHGAPLRRRVVAVLLLEPAAVLLVLAVPATHDLFHYYPAQTGGPGTQQFHGQAPLPRPGPLFWPHAVYTYLLMLGAVTVLATRLAQVGRPYRAQGLVMVAASVLPFAGNLVYNLGLLGPEVIDPSPFLFTVTAVVLVWGFLRLRLLGILPVARAVVVEHMADAVVVTDAYGRVVDVNVAARQLIGVSRRQLQGSLLAETVPQLAQALADHVIAATTVAEIQLPGNGRAASTRTEPGTGPLDLRVHITSVLEDGTENARVVVLRDVSDRRAAERQLRHLLDEQTETVAVLSQVLRPATLPQVPGAVLAARWLPAAGDAPVSGDFYDVHPATGGWAFVLGDVSGKGVRAGVVTAAARYAVRTLSAQGLPPEDVLRQLNSSLLSDDPERFCTVAYGLIEPPTRAGLRVRLALGGHPQPLVRRTDGSVIPVGTPGTVLGLMAEVDVTATVVDLAPGESLLAYSDGVTEARLRPGADQDPRSSGGLVGEARLADALASAPEGPEEIADALLDYLTGAAVRADDVTLLVVHAGSGEPVCADGDGATVARPFSPVIQGHPTSSQPRARG